MKQFVIFLYLLMIIFLPIKDSASSSQSKNQEKQIANIPIMSIDPNNVSITATSMQMHQITFTVTNNSTAGESLYCSFYAINTPTNWIITFSPTVIAVAPNEHSTFSVTILIPPTALTGIYIVGVQVFGQTSDSMPVIRTIYVQINVISSNIYLPLIVN
ncbi:MAG: hypothetical protein KAX40_08910 [Herpetosiphon sp.]|nr:hypothetical protein [Herpetosiphon sp.]